MLISEFDYELPQELIAQEPLEQRDASRMLVVDRQAGTIADHRFVDLPNCLTADDLLVLNNTRVFPARLLGQSETGASVEIFLVRAIQDNAWEALARPAKRLKMGRRIVFGEALAAEVIGREDGGKVLIRFESGEDIEGEIDRVGRTPLPPYIKRDGGAIDADRERYQTVFAAEKGAIAAPTAGLHFSPEILDRIRYAGISIAELTLHVGYGTFEPVRVEDLADHKVMSERYSIDSAAAEKLNEAMNTGRRIVAVGTTTTRALEDTMAKYGEFTHGNFEADLTITPSYEFRAVGALLTNFHLPKSSLLVLTSTFGGHELIMKAYRHAVAAKYRFYSYGDCMLII